MKEKFLKIWKEYLWLLVILLLVVVIVRFICYQIIDKDYEYFMDTSSYSYLEYYETGVLDIDSFRTPVYPNFLRIMGLFGDDTKEEVYARTVAFQEIISLASVAVFFLIMRKLTKNRIIQSIATLYYGCLPGIFTYNLCVLTESLSISIMLFFLYVLFSYIQEKKIYKQVILACLTTFLTLLRPSFVYLYIFFAIFWFFELIFNKEVRKKTMIGILATCLSGGIISSYALLNEHVNEMKGIGLSSVSIINQTDLIIELGIYGDYEDNPVYEGITRMIRINYDPEEAPWQPVKALIIEEYGITALDEYNKQCIKNNLFAYAKGTIIRILKSADDPAQYVVIINENLKTQAYWNNVSNFMYPLSFGMLFFLITFELIIFLRDRIKKIAWTKNMQFRFWSMIILAGLIAVSLIAAQAEYQRLISPILSISIIIISLYIEKIFQKQEEVDIE